MDNDNLNFLLSEAERKVARAQTLVNTASKSGGRVDVETVGLIYKLGELITSVRNIYIYKNVLEGIPQKLLAEKFNLSTGRISQIVKSTRQSLEKADVQQEVGVLSPQT